jgi:hypothetical protein
MLQEHNESPKLMAAIAHAKNVEVVLKIVDDSLARAAEIRKQRQKEDQERQEKEDRDRRAEEFDRREQQSAAELADRNERIAQEISRKEQEADAIRLAVQNRTRADGGLDLVF